MIFKWSVRFSLACRAGGDSCPLRMRASWGGSRLDLHLPCRLSEREWDAPGERVLFIKGLRSREEVTTINALIAEWRRQASEIFTRFSLADRRSPSVPEFKSLLLVAVGRSVPDKNTGKGSLFVVYDEFVKTMGRQNSWSEETFTKFRSLRKHLLDFNDKLSLPSLTEDHLEDFVGYLLKIGQRNSTISKNAAFLRWFLRWASQRGHYGGRLHDTFRPRLKGVDAQSREVVHLSWDELMALWALVLPPNKAYLERVRDVFCFLCFTGLRFSDVFKLRRSDVKNGYISVVTQKTIDSLKIELNQYSSAILRKYEDVRFPGDKVLPVISNTKMNEYLKELGELAGLDAPRRVIYFRGSERQEEVFPLFALLTTHCGRRTFIISALVLGIPAEVIMKWTGHSDFKAMRPYIQIVDELKEREMDKFNR